MLTSDATFAKDIANKTCIVKFTALWCSPCKSIEPILQGMTKKFPWLTVLKLDVDENPITVGAYQINSVPVCILFKRGKPAHQVMGTFTSAQLESYIKEYLL